MTALLPVRGRLLLCRTTVLTSLQHSTVATSTQQQLRISQLCSEHQLTQRPPTPLQQTRHRLTLRLQILHQPTQLRPLQHQLPPLQRRPHLRLRPQQILLRQTLRPQRPRLPTQLQLHLLQLSQP